VEWLIAYIIIGGGLYLFWQYLKKENEKEWKKESGVSYKEIDSSKKS